MNASDIQRYPTKHMVKTHFLLEYLWISDPWYVWSNTVHLSQIIYASKHIFLQNTVTESYRYTVIESQKWMFFQQGVY